MANRIYLGRFVDPTQEKAFLIANASTYFQRTLGSARFLVALNLCLLVLVLLTFCFTRYMSTLFFMLTMGSSLCYLGFCAHILSLARRNPFPYKSVFLGFWAFEIVYGVLSAVTLTFSSPDSGTLFALHTVMALFAIYFYFPGPFLHKTSAAIHLSVTYWLASVVLLFNEVSLLYHFFSGVLLFFANRLGVMGALHMASEARERFLLHQQQLDLNTRLSQEVETHVQTRQKLEYLATVDPLTHTYNRRFFQQTLAETHYNARRYGHGFALLALDLDYFKRVNDRYGHGVGDEVLKWFAERVRGVLRESDVFARLGGEEFMVLLPETDLQGVLTVADRLQEAMTQTPFLNEGENLNLTVSMGATLYEEPLTTDHLMTLADDALYQSKARGRDQVNYLLARDLKTPLDVGLTLPFGDML